jgi:hypothetical protein
MEETHMSSAHGKLDRIETWFDLQNALHDEKMKVSPGWWHAGKIVFGLLILSKAFAYALKANALAGYALALLLFVVGLALTIESGRILLERWLARQA